MVLLKTLVEEALEREKEAKKKEKKRIYKTNKSGFRNIKRNKINNGYVWEYRKQKNKVTTRFSSTNLLKLLKRCKKNNIPIKVYNQEYAERTLEEEGYSWKTLKKNQIKVIIQ